MVVAAVSGPDEVKPALLNRRQGLDGWATLVAASQPWGERLRFLDHATTPAEPADILSWIPDMAISRRPQRLAPRGRAVRAARVTRRPTARDALGRRPARRPAARSGRPACARGVRRHRGAGRSSTACWRPRAGARRRGSRRSSTRARSRSRCSTRTAATSASTTPYCRVPRPAPRAGDRPRPARVHPPRRPAPRAARCRRAVRSGVRPDGPAAAGREALPAPRRQRGLGAAAPRTAADRRRAPASSSPRSRTSPPASGPRRGWSGRPTSTS